MYSVFGPRFARNSFTLPTKRMPLNPNPMVAVVISFLEKNDPAMLQKFEADLQTVSTDLGVDVDEWWKWPLPSGAVREGQNVLVREPDYIRGSVFPLLHKYFVKDAFAILKVELDFIKSQSCQRPDWKARVVQRVNKKLVANQGHYFTTVGEEIWQAVPSHPGEIMDKWKGPFSLTEDGVNFKYNITGIYLTPCITVNTQQ